MHLHQRGELGPAKRSASNALGEHWSLAEVVITAIMLPGRRCLFADSLEVFEASDRGRRGAHVAASSPGAGYFARMSGIWSGETLS